MAPNGPLIGYYAHMNIKIGPYMVKGNESLLPHIREVCAFYR